MTTPVPDTGSPDLTTFEKVSEHAATDTDSTTIPSVTLTSIETEHSWTHVVPNIPKRSVASHLSRSKRGPQRLAYRLFNRLERHRFMQRHSAAALLGHDIAFYRSEGQLRLIEVIPGVRAHEAVALNRDLVVSLCESHAIQYFMIPEPNEKRHRVGIRAEHWDSFVTALLAAGEGEPLYVGIQALGPLGARRRWPELTSHPLIAEAAPAQRELEVFRMLAPGPREKPYGRPQACLVERWEPDTAGGLQAPNRNQRAAYVGLSHQKESDLLQSGRRVKTFEVFTRRSLFEIDYPIDIVYMWVDGSDPEWLERKTASLRRLTNEVHKEGATEARFRDNGELRYSLRSVGQFAPWVRNVFLVTDRQRPEWLDDSSPRIKMVDHSELFLQAGRLPSFNSQAIGARLHHIEGLSEHYIHFNDDFFLARAVSPDLFFQSNGVSKFHLSRSTLPYSDPYRAPPHEDARRNVVDLLDRDFGRSPSRAFFHTPIAQRRSIMFELEDRYPEIFESTWASQFRSSTDYEINSWLHHYYGYLTNKSVPGTIRYDYFDIADNKAWQRMKRLMRRRDIDTFCINDNPLATDSQHEKVLHWMQTYYPQRSEFELPPDSDAGFSAAP